MLDKRQEALNSMKSLGYEATFQFVAKRETLFRELLDLEGPERNTRRFIIYAEKIPNDEGKNLYQITLCPSRQP